MNKDISITAASSCQAVEVATTCDNSLGSEDVSISGDSGSCVGTLTRCADGRIASMTCVDYVSGSVKLNGTLTLSLSGNSCEKNMVSSITANMTATSSGNVCDIFTSISSTQTADTVTLSGCMTVCGSYYEISTSEDAQNISSCSRAIACASGVSSSSAFEDIFNGACTYSGSGRSSEADTFSYSSLVSLAETHQLSEENLKCVLEYAACTANEDECISSSAVSGSASTCSIEILAGDSGGDSGESCNANLKADGYGCRGITVQTECEQSYVAWCSLSPIAICALDQDASAIEYHNCIWESGICQEQGSAGVMTCTRQISAVSLKE